MIVLARGGGSFEDLLPFSDERVVRAVAACAVPVVSAVGHEQDTPLCDLAADVRASTPTAAARLVVPDINELRETLARSREALHRGAQRAAERHAQRLAATHDRLRRAPLLAIERRRATLDTLHARLGALSPVATLERGYAIVHRGDELVAPRRKSSTATRSTCASPTAPSERPLAEPTFEEAQQELEAIVDAPRARRRRRRRADEALGARRGALPHLRDEARGRAGEDRGATCARGAHDLAPRRAPPDLQPHSPRIAGQRPRVDAVADDTAEENARDAERGAATQDRAGRLALERRRDRPCPRR